MRSENPGPSIPLDRAALCSDCQVLFAVSELTCPKCGGSAFYLAAKLIGAVRAQDDQLVLARGVLTTISRRHHGTSSALAGRMAEEIARFQRRNDCETKVRAAGGVS